MKLTPIKANMTEVEIGNKRVLFSYQTPVAYEDLENGGYYKTTKFWSKTTTRHINKWLPNDDLGVNEIDQIKLDNLLNEVK